MIRAQQEQEPIRIQFVALGCPKNLVDSETMLGRLAQENIVLVGPDDPAEAVIINTCGFIDSARQEAYEAIMDAMEDKSNGLVGAIIVAGCLPQLWGKKIQSDLPMVDAVVGLGDREHIGTIIRQIVCENSCSTGHFCEKGPWKGPMPDDRARLRLTDPHWAYLRISEGCSQGCAFCTIPKIRGSFRSKSPERILDEAHELIADGVVELNLIGQETSGYGLDIGYEQGLAGLIRHLNGLEGLRWLRILYAHPATMSHDIIDTMAQCERVVPYLDLPLQHINNRILTSMHRHIDRAGTEALLNRLRETIDNLTIRTTMLVGFPSETDEEFDELLAFVRQFRFEALGCFPYSPEPGTAAMKIKPTVPKRKRLDRYEQIMIAQQAIAFELADTMVGRHVECLFDGPLDGDEVESLGLPTGQCWYLGRHAGQAAEIDSVCYIQTKSYQLIQPGEIRSVKITERLDYDLLCEVR